MDDYINQQIEVISLFKCLHHESSGVTNSMSVHVSLPALCSRRPSEGRRHRETRLWGKEERKGESTFSSSSTSTPLSGCHVLFVSRGRLSADVARGSLAWLASGEDFGCAEKWSVLAWERESKRISNRGDGDGQRRGGGGGGERRTHSAMSLTWESFRQA